MDNTEKFQHYFTKMQALYQNEKVLNLLNKPEKPPEPEPEHTQEFIETALKKEKMRNILKEKKEENKEKALKMIENFHSNLSRQESTHEVVGNEISQQELSFKKRLERKKLNRVNSQPDIQLYNTFGKEKSPNFLVNKIIIS